LEVGVVDLVVLDRLLRATSNKKGRQLFQEKVHPSQNPGYAYANLPPIMHRFQVMVILVKFSLAREECITLTLSLWVIPCQCRHK